jgi:hypothetical protein
LKDYPVNTSTSDTLRMHCNIGLLALIILAYNPLEAWSAPVGEATTDTTDTNSLAQAPTFRYFRNNVEVPRSANHTSPITFNGKPIGTKELPDAPNGTVHGLDEGHHFMHAGWYITDTNGGSWEYLPEIREKKKSASTQPRGITDDIMEAIELVLNNANNTPGQGIIVRGHTLGGGISRLALPLLSSQFLDWTWSSPNLSLGRHAIELGIAANGAFNVLASSTAVFGELAHIAANALDIFW